MKKLLYLSLFSAFLWNCKTQKPTVTKIDNTATFEFLMNKTWLLQGDSGTVMQGDRPYTLTFKKTEDMRYQAYFGCNVISGVLNLEGAQMSFGQAMATKMYCENTTLDEGQVMELLVKIDNYKVLDGDLTLFQDKAPLLRFKSEE